MYNSLSKYKRNTAGRLVEKMNDYYGRRAAEYDSSMFYDNPSTKIELRQVIKYLRKQLRGRDVLEIACGPCFWTQQVTPSTRSILATDVNIAMLDQARRKKLNNQRVCLMVADAYDLPKFGKSFDAVFAVDFFCHVPLSKQAAVLSGLKRVLKPGGVLVLCDQLPNDFSWSGRFDDEGNHLQKRDLEDGSVHWIIKNFPRRPEIKSALGKYFNPVTVKILPGDRYVTCGRLRAGRD